MIGGSSEAALWHDVSVSSSRTLAQAASSCLGEVKAEFLLCKVFITLDANIELSVKAGNAGRGIPQSGLSLALDMKMLIAQ